MLFLLAGIALSFFWVSSPKRLVALRPAVLDPAVVFSVLFFVFYIQVFAVNELLLRQLVPHYASLSEQTYTEIKVFLLAYLALFWFGYYVVGKGGWVPASSQPRSRLVLFGWLCFLFVSVVFAVYVKQTGGVISFLLDHRNAVYKGQWNTDSTQLQQNMLRAFSGGAFLICAALGGYLQGVYKRDYRKGKFVFWLLPLPGTLVKVFLFSRGFFLYYLIYYLSRDLTQRKLRRLGPRMILLGLLTAIGIWLGLIMRDDADYIQIGTVFDLFLLFSNTALNGASGILDSSAYAIDAGWEGLRNVVLQLSPVPSFLYRHTYENNLTVLVFNIWEGSSRPMPFIGEAFYNLHWFSLIFAFVQGAWSSWIAQRLIVPDRGHVRIGDALLYMATLHWFVYMPHSGLRASTRYLVWLAIVLVFFHLLRRLLRRNVVRRIA